MSTKKASSAKKAARKKTAGKRAASGKVAKKAKATPKPASKAVAKRTAAKAAPAKRSKATATGAADKRPSAKSTVAPAAIPRRRAIFIDVENTSSAAALFEVIASLEIDRMSQQVEFFAVGNWRVVGQNVGRELAALGAKLVHSAPPRGVRDWSDLWIAVVAGTWIGRADAGDVLEIVSNDRAFDAVGDAAATAGVVYRRIQHRRGGASVAPEVVTEVDAEHSNRRRRRRPRRGRGTAAPVATAAAAATTTAKPSTDAHDEAHGASRDQMVAIVEDLTRGRTTPWVNLDVLEAALKRLGFQRPPNSPRLVTRLRRLKDFEVDSHGRVRLVEQAAAT